jgi:hypothetical protein
LFDTGADVTVIALQEFRKIPVEKRPTVKIASSSKDSLKIMGIYAGGGTLLYDRLGLN